MAPLHARLPLCVCVSACFFCVACLRVCARGTVSQAETDAAAEGIPAAAA